jgi:hypothetical protein
MDAKHMEKFLNDYTDHLDAINFVQNTAVSCGDLYSMLFPSSLKRRCRVENNPINWAQWWRFYEWRKNYQYVSHGMLIVTSFVRHYGINVMVIAFLWAVFQCLFGFVSSKSTTIAFLGAGFSNDCLCSPPRLLKSLRCNPDVRPTCACSGGRNIRSKWTKRT